MGLTTSVEFIRLIMSYASSSGIDSDKIYAKAGFDISSLEDTSARVSFFKFGALWLALKEESSDSDFGLHLGEKILTFPGHILFLILFNAPTLEDVLKKLCRYFNLLTDIHSPYLTKNRDLTELLLRYNVNGATLDRQSNETNLAGYTSVLRRMSDDKIRFEGVHFVHPRPKDISEHQRIFNAPLFFDQGENKLVFKTEYLGLPVITSNQSVLENLEKMAKELQSKIYNDGPLSEKVSQTIFNMVGTEKTEMESIARKLAISPRNFQNHLKKEGVTFQQLLNHVRKEKAMYMLKNENYSISEIAFLLGYAEQSVFSRAFKRWAGLPPRDYRSQFR